MTGRAISSMSPSDFQGLLYLGCFAWIYHSLVVFGRKILAEDAGRMHGVVQFTLKADFCQLDCRKKRMYMYVSHVTSRPALATIILEPPG